jgi:hypothetical protein
MGWNMTPVATPLTSVKKGMAFWVFSAFIGVGLMTFIYGLSGPHPQRAWQAYLINFLLWSAIAQGAVLFSAVMHMTKARWSGPLASLAESFTAFFPLSLILFLLLFFGRSHVFPWLHEDLHGKEGWLNIPFLFTRDCIGLLILYLLGFGYLFNAMQLKIDPNRPAGPFATVHLQCLESQPSQNGTDQKPHVGVGRFLYPGLCTRFVSDRL